MYKFVINKLKFAEKVVLKDIQVELDKGETLCILGPSGCGKTTLLNVMAGINQTSDFSGSGWQGQPPDIAYLFQEPRLLPWRTVLQNLCLIEPNTKKVFELLHKVGLDQYADYYPAALSLGMERRVALVRCLLLSPEIVLMDEALASLDESTAAEMRKLIKQLICDHPGKSLIYVTHDKRDAQELADQIMILNSH
ncbi:ABC transporter ATP-binding protein [Neptuniibacter caesariensis]|uniref:ABC transporter, ATP-binding protein n=1 Tax=Neptuniibacter caesariensis TaxID=207954 RepID=A0A7U8GS43_NEPCE|nr:ATP-binding cassette domain-containing protein [Neptuniibacter caesariensis]EAR62112.1 ABC transporter, ATP-binding protein [Oceanospirillum sp. MED92] [Neptuniibacter caesariensis]